MPLHFPMLLLPRLHRVAIGALISLVLACLSGGVATAAPLVRFEWLTTASEVTPGATEVLADLIAHQDDGADASYFTIGLGPTGVVTNVLLESFGSLLSVSDSFFGLSGGTLTLIGSAPSNPGSFGADTDVLVATLRLVLNTAIGGAGGLALLDLTNTAGAPALMANGTTAIPAQLAAPLTIMVVPEPSTGLLVLGGCLALTARRRWRSA